MWALCLLPIAIIIGVFAFQSDKQKKISSIEKAKEYRQSSKCVDSICWEKFYTEFRDFMNSYGYLKWGEFGKFYDILVDAHEKLGIPFPEDFETKPKRDYRKKKFVEDMEKFPYPNYLRDQSNILYNDIHLGLGHKEYFAIPSFIEVYYDELPEKAKEIIEYKKKNHLEGHIPHNSDLQDIIAPLYWERATIFNLLYTMQKSSYAGTLAKNLTTKYFWKILKEHGLHNCSKWDTLYYEDWTEECAKLIHKEFKKTVNKIKYPTLNIDFGVDRT